VGGAGLQLTKKPFAPPSLFSNDGAGRWKSGPGSGVGTQQAPRRHRTKHCVASGRAPLAPPQKRGHPHSIIQDLIVPRPNLTAGFTTRLREIKPQFLGRSWPLLSPRFPGPSGHWQSLRDAPGRRLALGSCEDKKKRLELFTSERMYNQGRMADCITKFVGQRQRADWTLRLQHFMTGLGILTELHLTTTENKHATRSVQRSETKRRVDLSGTSCHL